MSANRIGVNMINVCSLKDTDKSGGAQAKAEAGDPDNRRRAGLDVSNKSAVLGKEPRRL